MDIKGCEREVKVRMERRARRQKKKEIGEFRCRGGGEEGERRSSSVEERL